MGVESPSPRQPCYLLLRNLFILFAGGPKNYSYATEITKMLIAVKNIFIVSFIINVGTLSFSIMCEMLYFWCARDGWR